MSQFTDFVFRHPTPAALPVLTYPAGALTGASVRDFVTRAEVQVAGQVALRDRYGLAVVQSCMDLSVEAEAFGCAITLSDDEVPTVPGRLVTDRAGADALIVPQPGAGRTRVYLEAVRGLKQLPGDPLVLAGMLGPFSLASRLFGVSDVLGLTLDDPELAHVLLRQATQFLSAYAGAFKAAGADGIIMAEPTAGLLSPRALGEFSSAYVRQILETVEDAQCTLILHNCAARLVHLPYVLQSGVRVLHFGRPMDVAAALTQVPDDTVVCGNLDPSTYFVQATPEEVTAATRQLLAATRGRRNFVLSSGCDIPPRSSLANIDAFFAAAAKP